MTPKIVFGGSGRGRNGEGPIWGSVSAKSAELVYQDLMARQLEVGTQDEELALEIKCSDNRAHGALYIRTASQVGGRRGGEARAAVWDCCDSSEVAQALVAFAPDLLVINEWNNATLQGNYKRLDGAVVRSRLEDVGSPDLPASDYPELLKALAGLLGDDEVSRFSYIHSTGEQILEREREQVNAGVGSAMLRSRIEDYGGSAEPGGQEEFDPTEAAFDEGEEPLVAASTRRNLGGGDGATISDVSSSQLVKSLDELTGAISAFDSTMQEFLAAGPLEGRGPNGHGERRARTANQWPLLILSFVVFALAIVGVILWPN